MLCRDGELGNPIRFHVNLVLPDLNGKRIERQFGRPANGFSVQTELTAMAGAKKEVSSGDPLENAAKMRTPERVGLYHAAMV